MKPLGSVNSFQDGDYYITDKKPFMRSEKGTTQGLERAKTKPKKSRKCGLWLGLGEAGRAAPSHQDLASGVGRSFGFWFHDAASAEAICFRQGTVSVSAVDVNGWA